MNILDANTKHPLRFYYTSFPPPPPPPLAVLLSEQCLDLSHIFSHIIHNSHLKEEDKNICELSLSASHQALSHHTQFFSILMLPLEQHSQFILLFSMQAIPW